MASSSMLLGTLMLIFIAGLHMLLTSAKEDEEGLSSGDLDDHIKYFKKPKPDDWVEGINTKQRGRLFQWLLDGCWGKPWDVENPDRCIVEDRGPVDYPGFDGWYNNFAHPELGAVDTPLLRRIPANYSDGVYQPCVSGRPNPLNLSEFLMKGDSGSSSITGKNALLVFFGQQVVEEILDAQRPACPPEYFNIEIPKQHPYYLSAPRHSEMPVLRTRYDYTTGFSPNNPRQQLNEITPFIDGGLVYGTSKAWSDQLRRDANGDLVPHGLLASSHAGLFPEYNAEGRLPLANPPPPFYHESFVKAHQTAPVSRFFKARKWVIATQQHITVNNWLPEWLGRKLPEYEGYNPYIDPQIEQLFQSAAMRFGHTLVPSGVYLRDYGRNGCDISVKGWNGSSVRTCNIFWRPQIISQLGKLYNSIDDVDVWVGGLLETHKGPGELFTAIILDQFKRIRDGDRFWYANRKNGATEFVDIDRLLMGMAIQPAEREDNVIVEDLRGRVFGPLEFSRRDLMALNIQRGRDHGIPDYNTARASFGLKRVETFEELGKYHPEIISQLGKLYNSIDDVDVWVGGLLETHKGPGELFTAIILDQFKRIRDGDRFWYANRKNGLFSEKEIKRIEELTIYDIIMAVTKMAKDDIQPNPFRVPVRCPFRVPVRLEDLNYRCLHLFSTEHECLDPVENSSKPCYFLPPLTQSKVEPCTQPQTYDYFSGSEYPYILTFLGIGVIVCGLVCLLLLLVNWKDKLESKKNIRIAGRVRESNSGLESSNPFSGTLIFIIGMEEWMGKKDGTRRVVILLVAQKKQIQIRSQKGDLLRVMDVAHTPTLEVFIITNSMHLLLRVSHDFDLIVKFDNEFQRENFLQLLETFVDEVGVARERVKMRLKAALHQAVTKEDRQRRLEMFFRVVFSQAFNITHSEEEILNLDSNAARDVIYTELTINEFADALSMKPSSEFVIKMFALVDKDKNGFISFREFVNILIFFAKGTADEKAKLMFDMYDINGTGYLTKEDFINMIKSLMDTVNAELEDDQLEKVIHSMMLEAGFANKEAMDVEDFQRLLLDYKEKIGYLNLNFGGLPSENQLKVTTHRMSSVEMMHDMAQNMYKEYDDADGIAVSHPEISIDERQDRVITATTSAQSMQACLPLKRYLDNYAKQIFWGCLYTIFLLGIFAERYYYYNVEREHTGLRRIVGNGVAITRGAASAMMFTYSTLLLTMCRNTITLMRETFFNNHIPFDSFIYMHKYIAVWALFFTALHVIGHAFNFYHISTQTSDDLTCLFRNFYHATHEIPKFSNWCWATITGVTGVLLTILVIVIGVFSVPYARKRLYSSFWYAHSLYPLVYILMVIHGLGRLVQEPIFHFFFLAPCFLFTFDYLVSISRKKVEIPVLKAELLPSSVTMLEFKRPCNFEYRSGQWVRISCPAISATEFHPFTLSSAPHESNLTVHIRAVGPWTTHIRTLYDPSLLRTAPYPKIYLDGPFGGGHQDWYQYEVSILIGGGIGVTPFASILKDIVFRSNMNLESTCKKVYFVWVTRTQKHFEWLVDIIRELEFTDKGNVVSVHIFVTQFYQKFDLRTILLTRRVGIFSCGPPLMTKAVDRACISINKHTISGPIFQHHFKNF
ncbi:hypothetical protein J437_LFUL004593 [Ladona fulva]|uniref:NAD(P)H oxidase (H2O2-forming) n=1 Tax=Ladona fulva TaxID=123851 RepID=A0A8K0NXN7_LADFU|nr:hypothetical protein J437_LFUL004593 [Ladona fulva]